MKIRIKIVNDYFLYHETSYIIDLIRIQRFRTWIRMKKTIDHTNDIFNTSKRIVINWKHTKQLDILIKRP